MSDDASIRRRVRTVAGHLGLRTEHAAVLERQAYLATAAPVVIVGGAVLDVQAWPARGQALRQGTTVPGVVRHVAGGVARNVCAVLAALLHPERETSLLVTALGDDSPSQTLLSNLTALRTCTRGVRVCPGQTTPCVCAVFSNDGSADIVAAVAACDLVESHLTVDWIRQFRSDIARAPLVVLDANVTADTLLATARMASAAGVPVFVEPVSVAKATRSTDALAHITWIKPNTAELCAISAGLGVEIVAGAQPRTSAEALRILRPAIEAVLSAGCMHVITTLGPAGVLLSSRDSSSVGFTHWALPAAPVEKVVSTAGAGDALVAGFISSITRDSFGDSITSAAAARHALATGTAVAAAVVQHVDNAPPVEAFAAVRLVEAAQRRAGYVLA